MKEKNKTTEPVPFAWRWRRDELHWVWGFSSSWWRWWSSRTLTVPQREPQLTKLPLCSWKRKAWNERSGGRYWSSHESETGRVRKKEVIGGCCGLNVVRGFGGFRGELGEIPNPPCYLGLTNHLDLEVVEFEDPHSPCFFIQLSTPL